MPNRTLALLLFLASLCWGQASPSSCERWMQQGGPISASCPVDITAVGMWTATVGTASVSIVDASGAAALSGTGPETVYVRFGNAYDSLTPGDYPNTGQIVIAGQAFSLMVHVKAPPAISSDQLPVFTNYFGVLDEDLGCTKHASSYFYQGCTTENGRPGGDFDMPAVGMLAEDPLFGTEYTGVAPYYLVYTGLALVSKDGDLVITEDGNALSGIYATDGSGLLYPDPLTVNSNLRRCQFSRESNLVLYCNLSSASIYKATLGTPPAITYDGAIWTEPDAKEIAYDGTNAIQSGDWFAFINADTSALYAVNLSNPSEEASLDLTTLDPPIDGTLADGDIDYVQGPILDEDSNLNFIFIGVNRAAQTYKAGRKFSYAPGAATITYDGLWPRAGDEHPNVSQAPSCDEDVTQVPFQCVAGTHSGLVKADGQALWAKVDERNTGDYYFFTALRMLSKNANEATNPKVWGQGLSWVDNIGSYFAGASDAPYLLAVAQGDAKVDAATVTAASGSNPITITLSPDLGLMNGDSILCGGALGKTGINGTHTVTSIGMGQYTIPVTDAGTYTANSSACIENVSVNYETQEIHTIRVSKVFGAIQVNRDVQHRAILNTLDDYTPYSRLSISPDGHTVCFTSNGGVPYGPAGTPQIKTYCYENWMTATLDCELSIAGTCIVMTPNSMGGVAIDLETSPTDQDVLITFYTDVGLTDLVDTVTLEGPTSPRSSSISGLAEGTYYWKATAIGEMGGARYIAAGTFDIGEPVVYGPTIRGRARLPMGTTIKQ